MESQNLHGSVTWTDQEFERSVDAECQRIESHPRADALAFRGGRIVVRTLRVLSGGVVALIAWLVESSAPSIADKPFAQLTLGELGDALLLGILAIGVGVAAIAIAFGAAPCRPSLRERAITQVRRRQQREAEAAAAAERAQAREDATRKRYYKLGLAGRKLFELECAMRSHVWIRLVAVVCIYALIGLLVFWLGRGEM